MSRPLPHAAALLLLAAGCGRQAAEPTAGKPAPPAIDLHYRQNSAAVFFSLSDTNLTTAGQVRMVVDVHAPEDDAVVFPDVAGAVAPFAVADSYEEPRQLLPSGKMLTRHVWILDPDLPGQTVFQPMEIVAGATTIKTDPIAIDVRSVLPAGTQNPEIKDIAGPVDQLHARSLAGRNAVALVAVLLAAIAAPIAWRRRRSRRVAALPPDEAALLALDALLADPPEAVQFFHCLSRILRAYLEARYGLPALERTTSELADELDDERLAAFLRECDDIKFAHAVPDGAAEAASGFVRSYIEATREAPCN